MDTETLKAFIAVAEHQSFSLAAESLHLTQPAISKRIAALEKN
jgi:transcriptional regulator, LysR family